MNKILWLLALFQCCAGNAKAQWQACQLDSVHITGLSTNGTSLYVCTQGEYHLSYEYRPFLINSL
ncbi:MAG: hypothetical protein IT257_02285 [Chitinophagaceae bacterium]|nr:hypothetical protein [Chitinophagaceae bacterium]